MATLTAAYHKRIVDESTKTPAELAVDFVGKVDPKKHLEADAYALMTSNILQCLTTMLDTVVF